MKRLAAAVLLLFAVWQAQGQGRNLIWCFGHNAAIDFSGTPPNPDSSRAISRGSCTTICDTVGNLLFYVVDDTVANYSQTINGAKVFSANHQLMQFGDSLNAQAWYNEITIIPDPGDDSLYYIFTIGVTSFYGLYYSIVDLSLNNGLGAVIQKNVQLQSFPMDDCLTAIKHGNGRDWWLIFRESSVPSAGSNNLYYKYLISPSGITNFSVQSIGSQNSVNGGNICFNSEGEDFLFTNTRGMIEEYAFDRCSGIISNPNTIYPERNIAGNYINYYGSALSPNGQVLYVAYSDVESALLQFDLSAPNIAATEDTIWTQSYPINAAGYMRLAPDGKIHFSCAYVPLTAPMYPYADSLYNMYNMNLGVINYPDSLGAACDFQPYSFYLGGKRTYWGLPNNPDYDLGPLVGSPCDSLTGLGDASQPLSSATLHLTCVPGWDKLFVNAEGLKGRNAVLEVYTLNGRLAYSSQKATNPPYFTHDVSLTGFSAGMYVVSLRTEKESLRGKFVKE